MKTLAFQSGMAGLMWGLLFNACGYGTGREIVMGLVSSVALTICAIVTLFQLTHKNSQ